MILVTVGTQIPFDRLVGSVDKWAKLNSGQEVIAQVGNSEYSSDHMNCFKTVEPDKFEEYISQCQFIVSHAGMGSILTALRVNKPIIIMPRKAALGEHRNDHQLATSRSFSNVDGVYVVHSEEELYEILNDSEKLNGGSLTDSVEYKKLLKNIENLTA